MKNTFYAWMQRWWTRKSLKSCKKQWDCWEEASCAAANQIHSAIQWNTEREIEGEPWLEVSCWMGWRAVILQSLTSSALTTRFFNKWAFCQSFFYVAVSNQNVNCRNTQASDLCQSSQSEIEAAAKTRTGVLQEWSRWVPLSFMFIQIL